VLSGEDNSDEMRMGNEGRPRFLSNNAGGILGGISSGQPIVARFAVKPTSSILRPMKTITTEGQETENRHQGPPRPLRRHPRPFPSAKQWLALVARRPRPPPSGRKSDRA